MRCASRYIPLPALQNVSEDEYEREIDRREIEEPSRGRGVGKTVSMER